MSSRKFVLLAQVVAGLFIQTQAQEQSQSIVLQQQQQPLELHFLDPVPVEGIQEDYSFSTTTNQWYRYSPKCLDGSPGAFYLSKNPKSTKWLIYQEGGGWCSGAQDCLKRSKTVLGSSKTYAKTMKTSSAFFSSDCQANPTFCDWNKVFLPYCDGNSFVGNRKSSLPVVAEDTEDEKGKLTTQMLFFRGKHIL